MLLTTTTSSRGRRPMARHPTARTTYWLTRCTVSSVTGPRSARCGPRTAMRSPNSGTGQYTAWTTDSNGNYTGDPIGVVSGNSYALESLEPAFNEDLNGDGVIGRNVYGTTSLVESGGNYFLYAAGTTSGPELKYAGSAVTDGEFAGWAPIG